MNIETSRTNWSCQASRYLNTASALKGMTKRVLYSLFVLIAVILSANLIVYTS